MTSLLYFVGGLAIAGIGFLIGWKVKATKAKKELDKVYAQTSKELTEMKWELDEFHRIFVTSQAPDVASEREKLWKEVAKDIRDGKKKVANETKKEDKAVNDVLDKDDGITYRRPNEERKDYHAIASDYLPDDDGSEEGYVDTLIRKSDRVDDGIYEIEDYETRQNPEFPVEDLYFYEASTDVYTSDKSLVDPVDIPLMLGYNQEELGRRFLQYDQPQYIHVRNPEYGRIYTVYVCDGSGPR